MLFIVNPEMVAKNREAMKDNKPTGVDGIQKILLMQTV